MFNAGTSLISAHKMYTHTFVCFPMAKKNNGKEKTAKTNSKEKSNATPKKKPVTKKRKQQSPQSPDPAMCSHDRKETYQPQVEIGRAHV